MTASPLSAARSPLGIGEPAPWFRARSLNGSPTYSFDIAGGRPVLMLMFGSAAIPASAEALARVQAQRDLFDDVNASFYGVTVDEADEAQRRVALQLPGVRFFLDYDRAVSRLLGAAPVEGLQFSQQWLLFDRTLRLAARYPIADGEAAMRAFTAMATAPAAPDWAPVAMVPGVIEPEVCRMLIDMYRADGGEESGVMREIDGKTRPVLDAKFKVRRDFKIGEGPFAQQLLARLSTRLAPMVRRCFQFDPTRVERLIIGCYDAAEGGHFRAHRDDTTRGTAHRRFAVTINLNAEEYEGGDLCFPEFGPRTYRAPTGGAVVFSCSLLHQATPVTRGQRFALLPFLYDEEAEKIRDANRQFLAPLEQAAG